MAPGNHVPLKNQDRRPLNAAGEIVGKKTDPELWRRLRVGDRIRLVDLDSLNWHTLHLETKQAYKYLLNRRRPVTVYKVDEDGLPWVHFRFRGSNGSLRYDSMAMNHGGMVIVKPRGKSKGK
jgi:hypothetical protein